MKGKKVLALVMCAVMAAGITVPVMAEEKDDSVCHPIFMLSYRLPR